MSDELYALAIGDVDQSGGCSGGEIGSGGHAVAVVMSIPCIGGSSEVIVVV